MNTKRTHVVLPADLVSQIDTLAGKRKRSRFLADLASREVKRLHLLKALKRAAGSWKDEDHPELKNGAAAWIEQLRQEDEERFRRVTKR
jgi:hypothetical protein